MRAASSAKTRRASAARSSAPSEATTDAPKAATTAASPGVPGSDDLACQLVGVDDERPALPEQLGDAALPGTDAAGQRNHPHDLSLSGTAGQAAATVLLVTQSVIDPSGGSYDDLPEEDVATVLAVPLRLTPAPRADAPATRSRAPRPTSHRGPRTRAASTTVGPSHHRRTTGGHDGSPTAHSVKEATSVGLLAALIVFVAVAAVLAALTWLLG